MSADSDKLDVDRFLAALGHELRNPLGPILTAVGVARMKDAGRELERELAMIERHARHLARLVDDLTDVSRMARGQIQLIVRRMDVRDALIEAIEMVSPLMAERRHAFDVDIDTGLMVNADAARITQVFSNLLANAAKYTREGGQIRVRATQEEGAARIVVEDNGVGIAPELLDRLFEPFFQKDWRAGTRGLGLGLALVRAITELHGGTVSAHSEGAGKGSTFVVRLPLASRTTSSNELKATDRLALSDAERLRILIVDADPEIARFIEDLLRARGHECEIALDAVSGLRAARQFQPHLAIVDINLPVMDGFELCERLRADRVLEGLRILVTSGCSPIGEHEGRMTALGIERSLGKPLDMDALLDATEKPPDP